MAHRETAYVYGIYDTNEGLLKIGQTTNKEGRLFATFGVGRKPNLRLVFCFEVPWGFHRGLEELLHQCLWNARTEAPHLPAPTEWFAVTLAHAQLIGRIAGDFIALAESTPGRSSDILRSAITAAREAHSRVVKAN